MVDPAVPRTRAQFARESASRSRALEPGPGRPGYLVDPAGPGTRPRSPGLMAYQAGHRTLAQVARESWSIPWALRNQPESPGTDGGPRGPWDPGPGCPGQLVDPPGTRSGVGVPRSNSRPRGPSDPSASHPGVLVDIAVPRTRGRVAWDTLSTPHAIGAGPEPPRISGRHRGHWKPGPGHPDYLGIPLDLGHGPGRPD